MMFLLRGLNRCEGLRAVRAVRTRFSDRSGRENQGFILGHRYRDSPAAVRSSAMPPRLGLSATSVPCRLEPGEVGKPSVVQAHGPAFQRAPKNVGQSRWATPEAHGAPGSRCHRFVILLSALHLMYRQLVKIV